MSVALAAQEIFGSLLPDQVNVISNAAERIRLSAGETVYTKGDKAHHFLVVLSGEITLRLPGKDGFSVVIGQLGKGAMFGSCLSAHRDRYALTAQCTADAELLKVENRALKAMMDRDAKLGYNLQSKISEIYFSRYIDTMKKLQAIVMNIPVEAH